MHVTPYDLDRSAVGRVHRARALAGLPDPGAKAVAFALVMHPSELSAYEVYATAEGFFRPEQQELTAPYVDRYFAGPRRVPGRLRITCHTWARIG